METLLEKVTSLEQEAQQLLTNAEHQGQQAWGQLVASEKRVVQETRERANRRREEFIKENVDAAMKEINSLHQEETLAIEGVKQTAAKNRAPVMDYVLELFNSEYNSTT